MYILMSTKHIILFLATFNLVTILFYNPCFIKDGKIKAKKSHYLYLYEKKIYVMVRAMSYSRHWLKDQAKKKNKTDLERVAIALSCGRRPRIVSCGTPWVFTLFNTFFTEYFPSHVIAGDYFLKNRRKHAI